MTSRSEDDGGDEGAPPQSATLPGQRSAASTDTVAIPAGGVDVVELAGRLGCASLERYGHDEEDRAWTTGIALLHSTLAAAPEHGDRTRWYFALGVAHGIRAEAHRSAGDFDSAIDWFSRLHAELSADDAGRDHIAVALIDAYWDRFWLLRHGIARDPETAGVEVERLVAAIERLSAGLRDPEATSYAQMMAGLAHLERFGHTEDRADLDRGITLLDVSVTDLPSSTPRLGLAGAELANALRLRAALDDDPASLDLCIATADRAIEQTGRADHMSWLMLHQNQALAHEARWYAAGERYDLDRAVGCWRLLIAAKTDGPVDPWEAAHLGDLLLERGDLSGDPADVADAIPLLDRATHDGPDDPDDPDDWMRWYELGRAHHMLWRLSQEPGSLEAADRCLDHALSLGVSGDDNLVRVHIERISVACDRVVHDESQAHGEAPASAARLGELLAQARAALTAVAAADPHLRWLLAVGIGRRRDGRHHPRLRRVRRATSRVRPPRPVPGQPATISRCLAWPVVRDRSRGGR